MKLNFINIEVDLITIIISIILGMIISSYTLCSCTKINCKEGFSLLNKPDWELKVNLGISRDKWNTMSDNKLLSENSLNYLSNNEFNAKCCNNNEYSSSNGCPCLDNKQIKYLNSRGGNN